MNIKTPAPISQALGAYQSKGPAKSAGIQASGAPASLSVALSAGSQSLYDVEQDVDMEKVQAIRQSLANGTLKINAERIADGLISSAAELIKR